ncbi:MAG: ABC transporter permease subunit [Rhodospirillales bacterium]|nr:ABC transporter permease subunit [Rhodospirillales bacterium]
MNNRGSILHYFLICFFFLFVLFLYGPILTILILSFQGPNGGLTFPLNGLSFHWFIKLWEGASVVDIWSAFRRSIVLGIVVMIITVILSVCAGLAFRRPFRGSNIIFYVTITSLIIPSIVVSLGIALEFRIMDNITKFFGKSFEIDWINSNFQTTLNMFSSGLGAQLTWTLPFGFLIMIGVFNRFNPSYEEAARDLGATNWQAFKEIVLPLIAPSLIGVALFGFTLSYDELARSFQVMGATNTLPLSLKGLTTTVTTPVIYALGSITTLFSFFVIALCLFLVFILRRRKLNLSKKA